MSTLGEVDDWRWLAETEDGRAFTARVDADLAPDGAATPAQMQRWREEAGEARAGHAIGLVRARRRHGGKFRAPFSTPGGPVMDPAGAEQATHWSLAAYKAPRFGAAAEDQASGAQTGVLDLCCGCGSDAAELARAGLDVTAVDLDPVRAWMAGANAGCRGLVGDATAVASTGLLVHADPGRRAEGVGARRRVFTLEGMHPPFADLLPVFARARGGAMKLGPSVDQQQLGDAGADAVGRWSLEYLSLDREVSQAVWWTGALADAPPVRATGITRGGSVRFTIAGEPDATGGEGALAEGPARFVFTADPAVERARLLTRLADETGLARLIPPALGLLTGDDAPQHGALAAFEVREEMAWQHKRVRAWLRAHNGGIVEVKTRAGAVDPDIEQRRLRGEGATPYTVFILRFGDRRRAIIAERCAP